MTEEQLLRGEELAQQISSIKTKIKHWESYIGYKNLYSEGDRNKFVSVCGKDGLFLDIEAFMPFETLKILALSYYKNELVGLERKFKDL